MSSRELEPTVQQSILDRLMDFSPQLRADPPISWSESVRQLRASVIRDLEWLLNSRRVLQSAPAHLPELRASVYNFGLPDLSSHSADSEATRKLLARQIEESINLFEPRLTAVQVLIPEAAAGDTKHRIRFSVDALLKMEPNPERVTFDTVLEVTSGQFQVSGNGHA
jgi:type VI secretion system protein ImpF